jgi:ABC-type glycerol-3-phosphate transport system permease component
MRMSSRPRSTRQLALAGIVALASAGLGVVGTGSAVAAMAVVTLTLIPILIVYPFVQRHFVKGMLIGAIKG